MWKEKFIFIISLLCIAQVVFSHPSTEVSYDENSILAYFIDPNQDGGSEICLSQPKSPNDPLVEVKINSITSSNQKGKSFENLEEQKPLDFVVQKLPSNCEKNFMLLPNFEFFLFSIASFLFVVIPGVMIVTLYFGCKYLLYLWICVKKDIDREEHQFLLVAYLVTFLVFILFTILGVGLFMWLDSNGWLYLDRLFKPPSINQYVVHSDQYNNKDVSKVCFTPQQLMNTLYTTDTDIRDDSAVSVDIVPQKDQLVILVKESFFTSTRTQVLIIEFFLVTLYIFCTWKSFDNIKNIRNGCRELKMKIDFKNAEKQILDSKASLAIITLKV